jgi:hypothetical protein
MWVPLVEKAYAKLHGCYEVLKGGSVPYALADLTVGESENVYVALASCHEPIHAHIGVVCCVVCSRDFAGLVREGSMWDRLSMFMAEKWLVGASVVVNGSTEALSPEGLLNVRHHSRAHVCVCVCVCVCVRACVRCANIKLFWFYIR